MALREGPCEGEFPPVRWGRCGKQGTLRKALGVQEVSVQESAQVWEVSHTDAADQPQSGESQGQQGQLSCSLEDGTVGGTMGGKLGTPVGGTVGAEIY